MSAPAVRSSDAVRHLVLGGSGFLGRALLRELGGRGVGTFASRPFAGGLAFDARGQRLGDIEGLPGGLTHVFVLFGDINPDRIFREPEATRAVNVGGTIAILAEILSRGLVPVYLSTDYVFDGVAGGYRETDPVSPSTAYGRQKAEVEAWLGARTEPWLICRSSKIVSGERGTHSILGQWVDDIRAGRTIRCALDQVFSPAFDRDTALALIRLAEGGHTGLFHVAGPEHLSRYELAALLRDAVGAVAPSVRMNLEQASLAEFPFAEQRPLRTWLRIDKLLATIPMSFTPMRTLCRDVAAGAFGPRAA